jgi:hypothetical protein
VPVLFEHSGLNIEGNYLTGFPLFRLLHCHTPGTAARIQNPHTRFYSRALNQ